MSRSPAPQRWMVLAVSLSLLLGGAACKPKSDEERGREAMEEMQKSMVDFDALALEQKTDRAAVEEVQRNLTAINEYQGEINGKIDSVTVNAIQAFQRTAGLRDDGLITAETRSKLAAAAAAQAKQ
jgi:murein L,D-transpeptidase YcbB/YkuD